MVCLTVALAYNHVIPSFPVHAVPLCSEVGINWASVMRGFSVWVRLPAIANVAAEPVRSACPSKNAESVRIGGFTGTSSFSDGETSYIEKYFEMNLT
jgi:hypothetical protein